MMTAVLRARSSFASCWFVLSLLASASGACRREPVAVSITALPQSATNKEALFVARCSGGDAATHYRWQLGVGAHAVPGLLDVPALLIATGHKRSTDIEVKCTLGKDGDQPVVASSVIGAAK